MAELVLVTCLLGWGGFSSCILSEISLFLGFIFSYLHTLSKFLEPSKLFTSSYFVLLSTKHRIMCSLLPNYPETLKALHLWWFSGMLEMSEDKPWKGPVDGCSAPSLPSPSQYAHQFSWFT